LKRKFLFGGKLFARGYGLIDHTNMEKYPAFNAYKKLVSLLSGSKVLSIKVENDGTQFSYKFKKNSAEFSIIWNRDGVESAPPVKLKCVSFDDEVRDVTLILSTPVVCGDKVTMEYINRVMK